MIDPIAIFKCGLRELGDACLLEIIGRCGTSGITGVVLGEVMRMPAATVFLICRRLTEAGLIHPPSRDTRQGRPNRYTISPNGLALLQTRSVVAIPDQQIPMPLPAAERGKAC